MDAKATMTRTVIFIEPEDSLVLAHDLMILYNFHHLPVVKEGKILGMLSDRDILRWSTQTDDGLMVPPERAVSDAMSVQVVTCLPDSSISRVASLMTELQIDALPVVNQMNELVGLVTSTDLLLLLAYSDEGLANRLLPFSFEVSSARQMVQPSA